ncbi:hypothetical protein [Cyanobium sp. Morenito 9A2]|uniref:hypothetical protein n=1 Tax=Cyanobium sp. Morenito 9A2 TaxID=2823718 RepID=UPI0020CCE780|nr:hypothetical protein [Cyanobium sp. Morenito 9A2]MCP9848489.1 hypothetical protein [Cyanobium sp. Morenito 9A2]
MTVSLQRRRRRLRTVAVPVPNNFGPTVLIAVGCLLAPIGVGLPLVLIGLARLKTADGVPVHPALAAFRGSSR